MRIMTVAMTVGLLCGAALAQTSRPAGGIHLGDANKTAAAKLDWQVKTESGMIWRLDDKGQLNLQGVYNDGMSPMNDFRVRGIRGMGQDGPTFADAEARVSEDGQEVELGPATVSMLNGRGFQIWRRIRVDPKSGCCRIIDILQSENPGSLSLTYRTTFEKPSKLDKAADQANGNIASIAVTEGSAVGRVLAAKDAKVKPSAHANGANMLDCQVTIPLVKDKPAAIVFFEFAGSDAAAVQKPLAGVDFDKELARLDPQLRAIIANVPRASLTLEAVQLPRDGSLDTVVLADGNELYGTVTDSSFALDGVWGKLELPASRVLGLYQPSEDTSLLQAALVDGQVVAGKPAKNSITLKLEGGSEINIDLKQLRSLAYRISQDKPASPTKIQGQAKALAVLGDGQRILFDTSSLSLTMHGLMGDLKLPAAELCAVAVLDSKSNLHQIVLENGTTLSGLLSADKLTLKTDIAGIRELPLWRLKELRLAAPPQEADKTQTQIQLANDDVLVGTLVDPMIDLLNSGKKVQLRPQDIKEIDFDGPLGQVTVTLHDKTTLGGKFAAERLRVSVPGLGELKVHVAQIQGITFPTEAAAPTTKPATAPAAAATQATVDDARK